MASQWVLIFLSLFLYFKCFIRGYNLKKKIKKKKKKKKKKERREKLLDETDWNIWLCVKLFFFLSNSSHFFVSHCLAIIIFFLSQNFLFPPQK
jgi:hypothetical protein